MYELTANPDKSRVSLTFDGAMDQDPQAFFAELTQAAQSVGAGTSGWVMLVDFSQTNVMDQQRAENTAKIFEWCLANTLDRIAFVMSGSLQKMQVRRVTQSHEKIEYFDTRAEAERWLGA